MVGGAMYWGNCAFKGITLWHTCFGLRTIYHLRIQPSFCNFVATVFMFQWAHDVSTGQDRQPLMTEAPSHDQKIKGASSQLIQGEVENHDPSQLLEARAREHVTSQTMLSWLDPRLQTIAHVTFKSLRWNPNLYLLKACVSCCGYGITHINKDGAYVDFPMQDYKPCLTWHHNEHSQ